MTWTSCVKAAAAPPAHTTHSLSATQTAASHEWVSLEPAWKRHYHPEPVSMSHPQLISFNEDKQCVRVPANNDWCHASISSYGKYGLENFRSKEFRAQAPRCWHPTHILLDPGSAGRGPQRTTAINNSLTRYSTQQRRRLTPGDSESDFKERHSRSGRCHCWLFPYSQLIHFKHHRTSFQELIAENRASVVLVCTSLLHLSHIWNSIWFLEIWRDMKMVFNSLCG